MSIKLYSNKRVNIWQYLNSGHFILMQMKNLREKFNNSFELHVFGNKMSKFMLKGSLTNESKPYSKINTRFESGNQLVWPPFLFFIQIIWSKLHTFFKKQLRFWNRHSAYNIVFEKFDFKVSK